MTEQDIIGLRRSYYSHVTLIDDPIRRIIGCLEKRGLLENTVIVFTADHGEQNGDYGLLFKQTFLESSVRVPLMISIPSQKGQSIKTPVELMDLGATLCDLLEIQQITGHSRSLVPLISGTGNAKKQVVSQLFGETMLLEDSFKAVFNQHGDIYLLFDLKNDPKESINLAASQKAVEIEKRLHCSFQDWKRCKSVL